jgi:hypothetical protein
MESKSGRSRILLLGGLTVFFLYTWISFIFTPLLGDIKNFLAAAKQASYISNSLIVGAFQSWELKSVLSRLLMVFLYKVVVIFTPYGTYAFGCVVKGIYSVLLIFFVFLAVRLVFQKNRSKILWATVAVSTLFMACSTESHLQVEMTGNLLILLAFALYWNAIRTNRLYLPKLLGAGMLIGLIFWLKSILLLMSVAVVAAVCIFLLEEGRRLSLKRMMIVVAGSLLSLAVIAGLVALINPSEFQEIINAAEYQESFFTPRIMWKKSFNDFIKGYSEKPFFTPVLLLGFVCLITNLVRILRSRKVGQEDPVPATQSVFFHLVLWLVPTLFVVISDRYFSYHFFVYLFPAVIEIGDLLLHRSRARDIIFTSAAVLAAGWYAVFFSLPAPNMQAFIQKDLQVQQETAAFLDSVGFDRSETVLYLDDGGGAYVLGNPSYLKHFFPLPLQRLLETTKKPIRQETLEKVLAYEGKYITLQPYWFYSVNGYPEIREKMEREYTSVGQFAVFSPPHIIFPAEKIPVTWLDLYVRNGS